MDKVSLRYSRFHPTLPPKQRSSQKLEFIEAAFDPISKSVNISAIVVWRLSARTRSIDGDCADGGDGLAQSLGALSSVAEIWPVQLTINLCSPRKGMH